MNYIKSAFSDRTIAVQAEVFPGKWRLPENKIWNVPETGNNFRFDLVDRDTTVRVSMAAIRSLRGLAVTLDGKVFGLRQMSKLEEDGLVLRGRLSIDGKQRKAFTGSRLFERPDGSFCDVAILIVHIPEEESK